MASKCNNYLTNSLKCLWSNWKKWTRTVM